MRFYLIHSALPLLGGGIIYILWRTDHLLMFRWFDFLGLNNLVDSWRRFASPATQLIPQIVLYSFPDGAWVYAFSAYLGRIWKNESRTQYLFWLSIAPVLAIGAEVGQFAGVVPGTFEVNDLLFCAGGALFAYVILETQRGGINVEFDSH